MNYIVVTGHQTQITRKTCAMHVFTRIASFRKKEIGSICQHLNSKAHVLATIGQQLYVHLYAVLNKKYRINFPGELPSLPTSDCPKMS